MSSLGSTPNVEAASPIITAATLRERADVLRRKVSLCELDIAHGAEDCTVSVPWDNRVISMDEARGLIARYLKSAETYEKTFHDYLNDARKRDKPINPLFINESNDRSAYNYAKAIQQFDVTHSKRYEVEISSAGKATYCSIFAWDVTRAMSAEIPRLIPGGEYRTANKMIEWLEENGEANGWQIAPSSDTAQQMSNSGKPTVATWKNPEGHGHIAIVRPGSIGFPEGPALAQAGSLVTDATHYLHVFGDPHGKRKIVFWYHE